MKRNTRQHRRIFFGVCVCAECRQSRLAAAVVMRAKLATANTTGYPKKMHIPKCAVPLDFHRTMRGINRFPKKAHIPKFAVPLDFLRKSTAQG